MTKKINIGEPQGTPAPFARLIGEIYATRVPSRYIEKIVITYLNGTQVEMSGGEIAFPVPLNKTFDSNSTHEKYKNVKEIKVFLKLEKLEHDINVIIMDKLGKYFQ